MVSSKGAKGLGFGHIIQLAYPPGISTMSAPLGIFLKI